MNNAFRSVALIGKYRSREIAASLLELARFLSQRGVEVLLEEATAGAVGANGYLVAGYEKIGERAELAVILGGDGTMLNAARQLARFDVPLVGINQGRLGFMTDIALDEMIGSITALLDGKFSREHRFLLDSEVLRDGEVAYRTLALNDVVVNKGDLGRMIELEVKVDAELIHVLRADGLIVSTPTGSTAYALSANGPILHPSVQGIAIVPLCPHALSNRPITVSDSSKIDIALLPPHDARVHFDGQTSFDARAGDVVRMRRSSHGVTLLHPPGYSYFAMLREKLHWSATPRH
ncbi:MAG: NAD kinase [Sterolibacteriaceae bacterium]|uniref:NAD kinase n=1 Tax=Sulfuritalea sp. TaxID=2480090 RepID=UPI001A505266|nr:NAD kinase [Sulfuritalea sp.]MBL8479636.1 NAD kinase [Sterolibacteriaceae bacterium]MBN8475714.1 NAD kinase [Sulfuritalea sp.]